MLFSLKLQRNNRQNALAVVPAKGKTWKRLYFNSVIKTKQPNTITEPFSMHYKNRLYHSIWLFYFSSMLKIETFSPIFPLPDSIIEASYWLFLWNFKKESINRFLWHSQRKKHQPFSMIQLFFLAPS